MIPPDEKARLREAQSPIRADAKRANPNADDTLAGRAEMLLAELPMASGAVVAGYWPIRSEISPLKLLMRLASLGDIKTALPATPKEGAPLEFHLWAEGDPLTHGLYGTSEPQKTAPLTEPDYLLVPLLAFDDRCYRLGYGGGFYDRSLATLRPCKQHLKAIGIAYAEQQVEAVPLGDFDAQLDAVLTPQGLHLPCTGHARGKIGKIGAGDAPSTHQGES